MKSSVNFVKKRRQFQTVFFPSTAIVYVFQRILCLNKKHEVKGNCLLWFLIKNFYIALFFFANKHTFFLFFIYLFEKFIQQFSIFIDAHSRNVSPSLSLHFPRINPSFDKLLQTSLKSNDSMRAFGGLPL